MDILITKKQLGLISELYDREKLYEKKRIIARLKGGPRWIRAYIKELPTIKKVDSRGEEVEYTKIPEVLHQFLIGHY